MIPLSHRAVLRTLWETCAAGGLNPSATVEQLSYLLLLKIIERRDDQWVENARRAGAVHTSLYSQEGDAYRWSSLVAQARRGDDRCTAHLEEIVFPWLRDTSREDLLPGCAPFLRSARLVLKKPTLLRAVIESVEVLLNGTDEPDAVAAIYGDLLSMEEEAMASSSKPTGRIFTPPRLARLLCLLVDIQRDDRVWEPCCGNGHLLAHIYPQLTGDLFSTEQLYGCDLDESCAFEAWMRLYLSGIQAPRIQHIDTLGSHFHDTVLEPCNGKGFATAILSNPPFSGVTDSADLGKSLERLGTTKTELLFLEMVLQGLQPEGRAAVIVPEGVLFGSTKAHRSLRHRLVRENTLHAVISLPKGTFSPWSNVKTDILFFQRGGTTQQVWFYEIPDMESFSMSGHKAASAEDDHLLDLLVRVRSRRHRDGWVPKEIDPDLWRRWQALEPEEQHRSFIRTTAPWNPGGTQTGEIVRGEREREWTIPIEEIEEKGLDLSLKTYKPFTPTVVNYPDPATLLRSIIEDEKRIQHLLNEMVEMVSNPKKSESRPASVSDGEMAAGVARQKREEIGEQRSGPVSLTATPADAPLPPPTSAEVYQHGLWDQHA